MSCSRRASKVLQGEWDHAILSLILLKQNYPHGNQLTPPGSNQAAAKRGVIFTAVAPTNKGIKVMPPKARQ
jgi:hypothetical protein